MDCECPCQGTNWDDCCSDCRWSQEYGYERFPTSKLSLLEAPQPDPQPQHQSDPQPLSDNSFGFEYILNGKLNRTYYSNENQKRLAEFTGRELDIFHEIQKGPKKGIMVKHRVNLKTLKVTNLENHAEHDLLVPEAMWQEAQERFQIMSEEISDEMWDEIKYYDRYNR